MVKEKREFNNRKIQKRAKRTMERAREEKTGKKK